MLHNNCSNAALTAYAYYFNWLHKYCIKYVYSAVIMQSMIEDKKRVTVAIPMQLHTKLVDTGYGVTEGIVKGLELLLEPRDSTNPSNEVRISDLLERINDLQAHNETLVKELEDIKSMHNNYMMQMQTVITQRAIEAPGAKKPWWRFW